MNGKSSQKNQVTYVFSNTKRSEMIKNKNSYSEEFFYGFFSINKQHKTNIVEFRDGNKLFFLVDRLLSKLTNMPIFFSSIISFETFKTLKLSTHIIFTNQRAAIACLPLLLILKFINNPKVIVFNMGIMDKNINIFDKFITHQLLLVSSFFINLGFGEHKLMKKKYQNFDKKIFHIPFPVDLNFWKESNQIRQYIIFVGNDSNRDFKFLKKLVSELNEYKFLLLTNSNVVKDKYLLGLKNVEIFSGEFGSKILTDKDLNSLYNKSFLSIVPLLNGIQPSGQSVTQQSLAVGTPVLITKTQGFWTDLFPINEGLYTIEKNNLNDWSRKIKEIINNKDNPVSLETRKVLTNNFSVEKFNLAFEKLVFNK